MTRGIYEELREDISIEEVLVEVGARTVGWGRGGWGEWKKIVCPFCDDTGGSASYNEHLGRFLCHQCGAPRDGQSGDVVDVAKLFLGTHDNKEAIEWLKRRFLRS